MKKEKTVQPTSKSGNDAKPIVKCSKTVRAEITRILYQNSSDDSECMRIRFEKIQGVIDEIMLCVG
jgi:hypothetical protein